LQTAKVSQVKETFSAVLKALLDIRVRLPPIFFIDPKLVLIDTATFECKILISGDMFDRKPKRPEELSLQTLRYMTPEELI
jgi:hypothetical protein